MGNGESPLDTIWSMWPHACSQNSPNDVSLRDTSPVLSHARGQKSHRQLAHCSTRMWVQGLPMALVVVALQELT